MAGITAISGLPGTGKSYTALELFVLPALREKRRIVTNLPLLMDVIDSEFPGAQVDQLGEFANVNWDGLPGGALLVIDEVWRLWPAGLKAHVIPTAQMSIIKEHRHRADSAGRSMDVVLVCQDTADIAASIRGMIEATIINVKHLDLGRDNAYRRDFYRGVVKGQIGPQGQLMHSENGRYKPTVYKYYKTHMNAVTAAAPDERRTVNKTIFGSNKFKAGAVAAGAAMIMMFWALGKTQENIKKVTTKQGGDVVTSQTTTTVSTGKPAGPTVSYSEVWRLAGTFENYGGSGHRLYVLVNHSGRIRRVSDDHCRVDGYEDICEVDGEIVTWYSGAATPRYMPATVPTQASAPVATVPTQADF